MGQTTPNWQDISIKHDPPIRDRIEDSLNFHSPVFSGQWGHGQSISQNWGSDLDKIWGGYS